MIFEKLCEKRIEREEEIYYPLAFTAFSCVNTRIMRIKHSEMNSLSRKGDISIVF